MALDRRSLIKAGAAVAVAGAVPLRWVTPALAQTAKPALDLAGFQRYVGTDFVFGAGARPVTMPLSKVTNGRPASATSPGEVFSLTFTGPQQALSQGTYTVDHKAFGRFSMFLVPVGQPASTQAYEAVFNRMTG